ncbi:MAG: hypothetical protein J6I53_10170 [Treponema sp.]|nr:hypothetical protein [Treponema sp.]
MKSRFLYVCFIVFSFFQYIYGADITFSLEPVASLKASNTKEALFFDGYFGTDSSEKCSQLEWREKFVLYYGLQVHSEISTEKNSFLISAGFDIAFPYNKGKMTDSDWNKWGEKSTYSEFENKADRCYDLSASFLYERKLTDTLRLSPSFYARYSHLSFVAENGHGWYYMDTESPHYYPDGKYHLAGIEYESEKISFFFNVSIQKTCTEKISFFIGCGISPFTYAVATDRHLGSKDYYVTKDYIYAWFSDYRFFTGINFQFSPMCSLNTTITTNYMRFTKGEEYYDWDDGSKDTLSSQDAGYEYYDIAFRIGVKIILFGRKQGGNDARL